jgi:predicted RNA-binding Zn-ribbon protein involved in translation (DUF1610 family)
VKKIIPLTLVMLLLIGFASLAIADATVKCDSCGKKFNVPEDLFNFKCPYCGYEYDSWYCSVCGKINFVPLAWKDWDCWNCGTEHKLWYCGSCGAENFVPSSWSEFDCWKCGTYNTTK